MERTRIKLEVYIDLDPTPGAMHSAESAQNLVRNTLTNSFAAYRPTVSLVRNSAQIIYGDRAVLIQEQDLKPGGLFFMNSEAVVGWYCVRSEDPEKRDLFLPRHIFKKCFRWLAVHEYNEPSLFYPVAEK